MLFVRWKKPEKLWFPAAEAAMKSFNSIHPGTSYEKLETWSPADLGGKPAVSTSDAQKEQILTIFRPEAEDSQNKKV